MAIRTLLVDDHRLVLSGMRSMLQAAALDIEIVGEAETGEAAIRSIRELKPDVVVLDFKLPDISGLEVTQRTLQINPNLLILIVSSAVNDLVPFRLLEAGARGYLSKSASGEELADGIRDVYAGKSVISAEIAKKLALSKVNNKGGQGNPFAALSSRELEVMTMVVHCVPVNEIAKKLHVSTKTVHSYRSRIFEKINVKNDVALTVKAISHGILTIEESH